MIEKTADAAAYIRVSTDEQKEFSPESQLDRILSFAENHGYRVKQENIFYDCGISGKSINKREGFKAMIEKAKIDPAPFSAILVWKFSRFARSREDSIFYKSMLRKKYGIRVISVSEDIGDDKMSVLIEAMIEAMDEFYSVNLGEEVKRGMTKRAEKGKFQSRTPFGYRLVNGSLIPCDSEKEYVKLIFSLFLSGKNPEEISKTLNEIGSKTSAGNFWTARAVRYILQNPVYAGYIVWDNTACTGIHKPLISSSDYRRAKILIDNHKKTKNKNTDIQCWFLRFMRCSSCGGKFCICGDGKNLQCINYIKHKCGVSHSISIKRLDESLKMIFYVILSSTKLSDLEKSITNDSLQYDTSKMKKQMQLKYERAKSAYEDGIYSIDDLKRTVMQIKKFEADLENKNSENKLFSSFSDDLYSSIFDDCGLENLQKESVFSSVIDKIIFHRPKEKLEVIFNKSIYNNLMP